ncbi:hypothetical protein QNH46_03700 [Paenibacillus woosongensis]|uniref:Uncharacterized protein n=1 Tax=Paenibacillus woosongensis TaxID=307580 RepID=A0AA95L2J4_9BACL|nr:hypothetical protein [Paenibacillus woosongensis]WHX49797.1 hypothetical protein QNH46_03700 [Paenibacillus woosongensis]
MIGLRGEFVLPCQGRLFEVFLTHTLTAVWYVIPALGRILPGGPFPSLWELGFFLFRLTVTT